MKAADYARMAEECSRRVIDRATRCGEFRRLAGVYGREAVAVTALSVGGNLTASDLGR